MKKMVIVLGLIATLLLGVTYVYAQGPAMGHGHRGMHESLGPGKDHALTPEQKSKFQELRRKFREENAKLIGAMVTKRLELQSLWTNPKADPKTILDKERELRDLQNQLRDNAVQMRLEVLKFLTPEQIENWKPGMGMGRGQMMGCGPEMGHGAGMGRGHGMMQ